MIRKLKALNYKYVLLSIGKLITNMLLFYALFTACEKYDINKIFAFVLLISHNLITMMFMIVPRLKEDEDNSNDCT